MSRVDWLDEHTACPPAFPHNKTKLALIWAYKKRKADADCSDSELRQGLDRLPLELILHIASFITEDVETLCQFLKRGWEWLCDIGCLRSWHIPQIDCVPQTPEAQRCVSYIERSIMEVAACPAYDEDRDGYLEFNKCKLTQQIYIQFKYMMAHLERMKPGEVDQLIERTFKLPEPTPRGMYKEKQYYRAAVKTMQLLNLCTVQTRWQLFAWLFHTDYMVGYCGRCATPSERIAVFMSLLFVRSGAVDSLGR
jgi:hypothetical protein